MHTQTQILAASASTGGGTIEGGVDSPHPVNTHDKVGSPIGS